MANQLYLIIGIIISNTSWAFVCNGWYKQKMLAGIENGIPFVWDKSLIYYVAIIPAIIGIVFIIKAYKNVVEEYKPKNKKKFTKKTNSFDKNKTNHVQLIQGEKANGIYKQNRSANQRARKADASKIKDRR